MTKTALKITSLVLLILALIMALAFYAQFLAEQNAYDPDADAATAQIEKLRAEIRQIRSDTAGSLFMLKMIALFVTVGAAVSGYLWGQSETTRRRLAFEHKHKVEAQYQTLIQELSHKDSALLRAAAAVKLGSILRDYPVEWLGDLAHEETTKHREQRIDLTKQVLAASLTLDENEKVRKATSIALVQHRPWEDRPRYADARGIDLSGAKAQDAYWARVDFSEADFFDAQLQKTSFRKAVLHYAQFREADLNEAVLAEADAENANFNLADLRDADFTKANLQGANFRDAKVAGATFEGAAFGDNLDHLVDISTEGNGSRKVALSQWLNPKETASNPPA